MNGGPLNEMPQIKSLRFVQGMVGAEAPSLIMARAVP